MDLPAKKINTNALAIRYSDSPMPASEHAILFTHSSLFKSLDILISLLRKAAYHDAGGAAVQAEVSEKKKKHRTHSQLDRIRKLYHLSCLGSDTYHFDMIIRMVVKSSQDLLTGGYRYPGT